MLYRWLYFLSFLLTIWAAIAIPGQAFSRDLGSFTVLAPPSIASPAAPREGELGSPQFFVQEGASEGATGLMEPSEKEATEEEGEEEDEIETDRDSFTPSLSTVATRRLIMESAWTFIDNRNTADTHSLPEYIARYGVTDHLELRFGWNYEVGGEGNSVSGGSGIGEPFEAAEIVSESQVVYGIKSLLTKQNGWLPHSIAILQAGTPTSGPNSATSFVGTYGFGWDLPKRWKWDSSIRYSFDSEEGDHFNIWAPSTVLKRSFGERWCAHIEYFAILSDGREEEATKHYISPGVHYLLTSDFEIGIRFGWGLNEQSANFFSNIGGGYRF